MYILIEFGFISSRPHIVTRCLVPIPRLVSVIRLEIFFPRGGAKICWLEISEGGARRFSLLPDVYFNFFRGGGCMIFFRCLQPSTGSRAFPTFFLLLCDRFFIKHIILQQLGISNE